MNEEHVYHEYASWKLDKHDFLQSLIHHSLSIDSGFQHLFILSSSIHYYYIIHSFIPHSYFVVVFQLMSRSITLAIVDGPHLLLWL